MSKCACVLIFLLAAYSVVADENSEVASARIESCPSCSLNRLPEVKKFIYEDIPSYGIEFKRIHGAPPELVLLNSSNEEIDRIPLSKLSRAECNELMETNGFRKAESKTENNEF